MCRHRLPLVVVLAACLICSWSFLRAKAPPVPIVGRWELTGFGDGTGDFVGEKKLRIDIKQSGTFDYELWENENADSGGTPFKVSGNWTLSGDVLSLSPWDGERLKAPEKVYRVAWDGATLLLYDEEDGERAPPPARFARGAGSPR